MGEAMRKWLKRQVWNVCWEIGDTFMGWAMNLGGLPDETWGTIDIHANCQPKVADRTIYLRWEPGQGLVEQPGYITTTTGSPLIPLT
jgi:hypothetical protein